MAGHDWRRTTGCRGWRYTSARVCDPEPKRRCTARPQNRAATASSVINELRPMPDSTRQPVPAANARRRQNRTLRRARPARARGPQNTITASLQRHRVRAYRYPSQHLLDSTATLAGMRSGTIGFMNKLLSRATLARTLRDMPSRLRVVPVRVHPNARPPAKRTWTAGDHTA